MASKDVPKPKPPEMCDVPGVKVPVAIYKQLLEEAKANFPKLKNKDAVAKYVGEMIVGEFD